VEALVLREAVHAARDQLLRVQPVQDAAQLGVDLAVAGEQAGAGGRGVGGGVRGGGGGGGRRGEGVRAAEFAAQAGMRFGDAVEAGEPVGGGRGGGRRRGDGVKDEVLVDEVAEFAGEGEEGHGLGFEGLLVCVNCVVGVIGGMVDAPTDTHADALRNAAAWL